MFCNSAAAEMVLIIQINSNQPPTTENNSAIPAAQDTPLPEFTDAETAFAEGNKLFDTNKIEKAIEAYKQAINLNPDLGEAYFKLGISYSLLEKEKETKRLMTKKIRRHRRRPQLKKAKKTKLSARKIRKNLLKKRSKLTKKSSPKIRKTMSRIFISDVLTTNSMKTKTPKIIARSR